VYHPLPNLFYLLRKEFSAPKAVEILKKLKRLVTVLPVDESVIAKSLESDFTDFEDAIRNAVSLGGDADTLACITGGIAQAFYGGVPELIQMRVYDALDERMGTITREFMKKHVGKQ